MSPSALRIILALAVVTVGALACTPPGAPEEEGEGSGAEETPAALVETVTLDTADFREMIELNGETSAIRAANVTPEIPGRITSFELEEGQFVEAGVDVLRVDSSLTRSQIDQLEIQRDQLDRDIDRLERLIDRGLANSPELEAIESQRDAIDEQIDGARISVRQARTETPIAGIVTETMAEEGEYASPGQPVARIVDISTIVVEVGLPEREISYVREGMSATVRIEATGQELVGTIERIGIEANTMNRTFPMEVHLDNSEGRLRAGMRATVIIPRQELTAVVVIPRDAVLQAVQGEEVFVVENDTAVTRTVELGPGRGRFVVANSGVNAGDVLVVRGHRSVVPGEPLDPIDTGVCCSELLGDQ